MLLLTTLLACTMATTTRSSRAFVEGEFEGEYPDVDTFKDGIALPPGPNRHAVTWYGGGDFVYQRARCEATPCAVDEDPVADVVYAIGYQLHMCYDYFKHGPKYVANNYLPIPNGELETLPYEDQQMEKFHLQCAPVQAFLHTAFTSISFSGSTIPPFEELAHEELTRTWHNALFEALVSAVPRVPASDRVLSIYRVKHAQPDTEPFVYHQAFWFDEENTGGRGVPVTFPWRWAELLFRPYDRSQFQDWSGVHTGGGEARDLSLTLDEVHSRQVLSPDAEICHSLEKIVNADTDVFGDLRSCSADCALAEFRTCIKETPPGFYSFMCRCVDDPNMINCECTYPWFDYHPTKRHCVISDRLPECDKCVDLDRYEYIVEVYPQLALEDLPLAQEMFQSCDEPRQTLCHCYGEQIRCGPPIERSLAPDSAVCRPIIDSEIKFVTVNSAVGLTISNVLILVLFGL